MSSYVKFTVCKRSSETVTYYFLSFTCFLITGLVSLLLTSESPALTCPTLSKWDVVVVQNVGTEEVEGTGLNVREVHTTNDNIPTGEVYNGTTGTIMREPVQGPKYIWYYVKWDTQPALEGWSVGIYAATIVISTTLEAHQKNELAEALFKLEPGEADTRTNHDYNDFGCNWDGDPYIGGGHPGWDIQTKNVVNRPEINVPFYSLTKGTVIRVGKITHDFKTGKKGKVLDLLPLDRHNELRATLENNKTIAVYDPINRKTTLYVHARRVFVSPGDDIFVGSCLGIQGKTGNALGVHVHIEVRDEEQPVAAPNDSAADPPIPYLYKSIMENQIPAADVNRDGQVDLVDAKLVVENIGRNSPQFDINGDGTVNIPDLAEIVKYLKAYVRDLNFCPSAPPNPVYNRFENTPIRAAQVSIGNVVVSQNMVQQWLDIARETDDGSLAFKQSIAILKSLLATVVPQKTVLFANYPNPFNPETWIPYYLAKDSDVTVTIYDAAGRLVRQLDIGYQKSGYYTNRNRAVYWDGKSDTGEHAASGVYFYTLTTDEYTITRKMVILK